ncbi:MAG: pitrilysin family protein [Candidatus Paceibacterota bacterium]
MYKFQLKTFPNGLRILMVPSKESLSFQITVLVNTGTEFESKNINGISHFLEHLCFKGTKKRPSNLEITQALDNVGGSYNAFTSDEITGYWAKVASKDKDLALDIVSDIYLNSQFPEKEIEKEKGVIIEEINMYRDVPQQYVWDLWHKLLYSDQPAGWSTLGLKQNIKKFQRDDFLRYHLSQYRSKSTLVVISGDFQIKEIIEKIKEEFKNISRGERKNKIRIKEKQNRPQVFLEGEKTDQAHLLLGLRGINLFDKRKYALDVLDAIFDGGMSGILFQTVREKLGAAYYVRSIVSSNTDYGFWVVKAGINNNRLEIILEAILKEWKKLRITLLTAKEIKKAKNYLNGKISLSMENVHEVANDFAYQELLKKKIETPQEYLQNIKKVTAYDLRKVAQDLLIPRHLNLALISPYKNKEKLVKILKNNF